MLAPIAIIVTGKIILIVRNRVVINPLETGGTLITVLISGEENSIGLRRDVDHIVETLPLFKR